MIHHVSIPAADPKHVAEVLAELMSGRSYPFPALIPGSFMAVSGDEHATMIEVYPADDHVVPLRNVPVASHVLLSVPAEHNAIMGVGAREGWRTQIHGRGVPGQDPFFYVIELWIENRIMLELVPEDMMEEYIEQIQIPVLDRYFAQKKAA